MVNTAICQAETYYLTRYGDIVSENTYNNLREVALNSVDSNSANPTTLFEEVREIYRQNDSIIYSYRWIITDNLAGTEQEFKLQKSLLGKQFPMKDQETLQGLVVNIENYKGKPTLINLWFTACPPCVREMPALNKLKEEYRDQFNFLAITMDSKSKVLKFLKKHVFEFDQIVSCKELTTRLGFSHYPMNLFLDKEGNLMAIENSVPVESNDTGIPALNTDKFLWILKSLQ